MKKKKRVVKPKLMRTSTSERRKQRQIFYSKSMSRIHYWMTLLILTICSFLITIILIPFMLIVHNIVLYLIVIMLGLLFGLIFTFIVLDLEHLEKRHHVFAGLFIPLIALINMLILIILSTRIAIILGITIYRDPLVISILYLASFVLPYLCYSYSRHLKAKKK